MRAIICVFSMFSMFIFFSCEKNNINTSYPCNADNPVLQNLKSQQATYFFDQDLERYVLRYAEPNTIDTENRYLICNVPEEKLHENGIYLFSGEARKSSVTSKIGGLTYYELTLSFIRQQ